MPDDEQPQPNGSTPELLVLTSLKGLCEQIRRQNRSPDVARVALVEETRLAARIVKLQAEAQPVTVAVPA